MTLSILCIIFGSSCGYRFFSLREGGLVCRSSVSACAPYIPNASEPITHFSQRVWCGAQHFQSHLWEFVAFFGLNCSPSGLTTTSGYSPLGIAFHPQGFTFPVFLIYLPFLPRFSTSPAHASCGDVKLHTLCVNTTVSTAVSFNHSAISCLHLLYAVPLNLLVHAITFHFCLLYTSPSPRDKRQSRMPSSA